MIEIVGSIVILMLIGAVAGLLAIRRANTRKEVGKAKPDPSEFNSFWGGY